MRCLLKLTFALLALIVWVIAMVPAMAARGWMQELEIRGELVGLKLAGIYPSNVTWSEFIAPDGSSDYEEEGIRRRGKWRVAGELFCFEYPVLIQGGCFRVVKHGPNCYELYTASIGGTVPAEVPSHESMSWNGRMWRETARSTCEDKNVS
jgi:hypothetical protein